MPAGSWQHLCPPAFVAEQLLLGLLQPTLGLVWPRNEGARGGISRKEMRCWQEDAQPKGTEPGAWWGGSGHGWEVLGQQGPNVQGANLVPTEMPGAHRGPGRDALLGGDPGLSSLPAPGVPAVPQGRGTLHPPSPPSLPVCAAGTPARGGGRQPPFTQISARGKKNKALYFGVIKTKRGAAVKPQPERCPHPEPKAVEFAPGGSEG